MKINSQQSAVALFVRHPVPGRVKTRLALELGDGNACDLYCAMVADIIDQIQGSALPLHLFHDGQDAAGLPAAWLSAADAVVRQQGDTLGERMTSSFESLFSSGRERVILIGSDIPAIDAPLLQSADAASATFDVVLSPALDGGYCLVASNRAGFNAMIFRNIPWSTAGVLEATLDRCTAEGLTCRLLDPRQDIDTLADIRAYCRQPSAHADCTNGWLVAHGYMELLLND